MQSQSMLSPVLAPSCRAETRDKRRLAAELRARPASGEIRAGFACCVLFRGRPTTIALSRPHIGDHRMAAFMNMNMLDPHVLPTAMSQVTENHYLHRVSLR